MHALTVNKENVAPLSIYLLQSILKSIVELCTILATPLAIITSPFQKKIFEK